MITSVAFYYEIKILIRNYQKLENYLKQELS